MGAALRFSTLDLQSYWYDEAHTVDLVRRSFWGMLTHLTDRLEITPPLYFVLAWGWSKVFGVGEAGLRSLSAVFGTATVPVAFAAGKTVAGRRVGLILAALVAVSPILVWYSQEARGYALVVLLTTASLWLLAGALESGSSRTLWSWALVSVLALGTHYLTVFLVAAEAGWLLLVRRTRRAVIAPLCTIAVGGAALLPLAIHQYEIGKGSTAFIRARSLPQRIADTLGWFVSGRYPTPALVLIVLALCVAVWLLLSRRGSRDERRAAFFGLSLGAAALLLPLLLTAVGLDTWFYKYLITAWVPLALAVSVAFGARRGGRAAVVVAAVSCAALLAFVLLTLASPHLYRPDWRRAAKIIGAQPGPRAIVVDQSWQRFPLETYRRDVEPLPANGTRVRELDVLVAAESAPFRAPPGFRPDATRQLSQLRLISFRSTGLRRVSLAALERGAQAWRLPGFLLDPRGGAASR